MTEDETQETIAAMRTDPSGKGAMALDLAADIAIKAANITWEQAARCVDKTDPSHRPVVAIFAAAAFRAEIKRLGAIPFAPKT